MRGSRFEEIMGGTWSMLEPEEMRLASRDLCDEETWANTVVNRTSSCSVQERIHLLASEMFAIDDGGFLLGRQRSERRLAFAKHDTVCVFERHDEDIVALDHHVQNFNHGCGYGYGYDSDVDLDPARMSGSGTGNSVEMKIGTTARLSQPRVHTPRIGEAVLRDGSSDEDNSSDDMNTSSPGSSLDIW